MVNVGALNLRQLALEINEFLILEFGDRGKALKIAYVTGDNVLDLVQDPKIRKSTTHLNTGGTLDSWEYQPIIANAYIGQFGFVAALKAGADIVLAGRTTDAGSTQALATWWYGWDEEDYDNHALGLIAGHLIECGNYVVSHKTWPLRYTEADWSRLQTGGNFCGFKGIDPYYELAYPIIELYNDGHCVITKQPGQNGVMNIDTVRGQLVYEIQGRYYYNPDVIADLSQLRVVQEEPDRVRVSGFRGLPPPKTLKTAIQAYAGYQAEILVYAIGLDIEEKARSFEIQTRRELLVPGNDHKRLRNLQVQLLGCCAPDPKSTNAATGIVRVFAQAAEAAQLSTANFQYKVIQNLGLAFPGFTPNLEYLRTAQPRPYLAYFPALVDRSMVDMKVNFLDSDDTITVPHSSKTLSDPAQAKQQNYEPTQLVDLSTFGPTTKVPLGHQVYARSGDKGANVNIGLFPQGDTQDEWNWLRSFLTTRKFLNLLGEDARDVLKVERVEFPNLRSVHFVLFGLLGGGVTDTSRPDSLGKVGRKQLRGVLLPKCIASQSLTAIIGSCRICTRKDCRLSGKTLQGRGKQDIDMDSMVCVTTLMVQ